MEAFSNVLRSIRRDAKDRRDHLDIFREFLDHIGRGTHRASDDPKTKDRRANTR
jgi:hypothetical protein